MACEYRVKGVDKAFSESEIKKVLNDGLLDKLMIDNNISFANIKPSQDIANSFQMEMPSKTEKAPMPVEARKEAPKEPVKEQVKEAPAPTKGYVPTKASIRGMQSDGYKVSVSENGKTASIKMPNGREIESLPIKELTNGRKYVTGPNGATVYLPTEAKVAEKAKEEKAPEVKPTEEKKTRKQPIKGITEKSSEKAKEIEEKLRFSPNEFTGNETPEQAGLVDMLETFDKETGKKVLKNKPMRAIIRDAANKGQITAEEERILEDALEKKIAAYDKAKANPKAQKIKVELAEKIRSGKLGKNVAGLNAALIDAVLELTAQLVESGMDSYMALSRAIDDVLGKQVQEGRMSQEDFQKTKSEVIASRSGLAGIKKASVPVEAENNARRALESKSNADVVQAGKEAVDSGLVNPEDLVNIINGGGTAALSATETAALVYYKAKLNNELSDLTNQLVEDLSAGGNNELSLRGLIADREAKMMDFYTAAVRTGAEWSAAGRMRQMLMNENYDALFQINKYKSNNDGDISPDLEAKMKEWSAEIDRLNKEIAKKEAELEKALGNEAVSNIQEETKNRKSTGKTRGPKWSTSQDGKVRVPNSIIREYVESGITDIDELVDAVRERISDVYPNASTRQVRDAITGYARTINMSQDDISMTIQEMKNIGRMISMLEDLQNGIKKTKNKKRKRILSEREKELKEEIKRKLNAMPLTDEEISEKEENRLESYKKRTESSIRELQYKLDNKDYTKKPKPKPLQLDEDAAKLRMERELLKEKFELEHERLERKNRTFAKKILDGMLEAWNTPKALLATADLSAPLRQGILPLSTMFFTNPAKAYRLSKQMIKFAGKTEAYYEEYMARIKSSPEYALMKEAGLYLAEPNAKLMAKEESFQSNWAKHLPIYGKSNLKIKGKNINVGLDVVGRSERAYTGFLNQLRIEMFMEGLAKMQQTGVTINSDPKSVKAWAKYVNNATGRGTGGQAFEMASNLLSVPFFSPRLIAARLNTLFNPVFYAKMPAPARKMALKQTAGFLGVAAMAVILAKLMDDEDDDSYSIDLDPRSTDFAKLKYGNTRVDFLGGYQQYARFLTQFIKGEKVDEEGNVFELGSEFGKPTRGSITYDFFRNKMSPTMGMTMDFLTQVKGSAKYEEEQKKTTSDKVIEMIAPIWVQEIPSLYEEHGAVGAATFSLLSIFGMGVQQQEPKKSKSRSRSGSSSFGSSPYGGSAYDDEYSTPFK